MRILVDQDGVLADFDRGFLQAWRSRYPGEMFVPFEDRRNFYTRDDYPKELHSVVEAIYYAPGFVLGLPSIAGAVEALQTMLAAGHDVKICTSPLSRYEDCVLEKYLWVERHLGRDFIKRMILSNDKTLVRGDLLIDDKPSVAGAMNPEWEHIIFDRPYNREVVGKRRIDWNNWREVLGL